MRVSSSIASAAFLGAATGVRSMSGVAALSLAARGRVLPSSPAVLGSKRLSNALALTAIGESVADKTPFLPARVDPAPLAARMLFGGVCGALVATSESRSMAIVAGVAAAVGAASAAYHLRRKVKRSGGSQFPVALAEDLAVLGLACAGVALCAKGTALPSKTTVPSP